MGLEEAKDFLMEEWFMERKLLPEAERK